MPNRARARRPSQTKKSLDGQSARELRKTIREARERLKAEA